MTAPSVRVTASGFIVIDNPPAALGHVRRTTVHLVYVTHEYRGAALVRRVNTVGKSVAVTPSAITFRVPNTAAAREAIEMVRDEMVDAFAVGSRPIIELSSAGEPLVELVTRAEAMRRHEVAVRSAMPQWRMD